MFFQRFSVFLYRRRATRLVSNSPASLLGTIVSSYIFREENQKRPNKSSNNAERRSGDALSHHHQQHHPHTTTTNRRLYFGKELEVFVFLLSMIVVARLPIISPRPSPSLSSSSLFRNPLYLSSRPITTENAQKYATLFFVAVHTFPCSTMFFPLFLDYRIPYSSAYPGPYLLPYRN